MRFRPRRVQRVGFAVLLGSAALTTAPSIASAAVERIETPIVSTSPQTDVLSSTVALHVPMPAGIAAHPAACDWISYERFRSADGPTDPTQADSVAVLQPGILEGATAFDPVARNTIREEARRGRHVEVWGIDRRSNCLEDHVGLNYADETGDYLGAIDYYYRGKVIDGHTFAGFKASDRVLADIGIAQTMNDYNAVLVNELPSQAWREQHVICGGHSLGGPLTELYASWDFDGNKATTDDAGYRQCAGFFGFDTTLNGGVADASKVPNNDLLGSFTGGTLKTVSKSSVALLKAGAVPRHVDVLGISPETMTLLELVSTAADREPERDSKPFVDRVPGTNGAETLFRIAGSPDLASWVTQSASLRNLHYSAMALLGQIMDDNGGVFGLVRASFGYFTNTPLRRNKLPEQGRFIPGFAQLVSTGPLMLPAKIVGQPIARWKNYDQLGSGASQIGLGITTPGAEVTDDATFARILHEGPLNLTEDWFPTRLVLELGLVATGDRSGGLSGSMHGSQTTGKPRKVVIAGDGILGDKGSVDPHVTAPGYQHLDVLAAAEQQNNGQPELSSQTLAGFLDQTVAH
jgi:hypothetical protein